MGMLRWGSGELPAEGLHWTAKSERKERMERPDRSTTGQPRGSMEGRERGDVIAVGVTTFYRMRSGGEPKDRSRCKILAFRLDKF